RYTSSRKPIVLEPACGTGRLLIRLLKAGYDCTGMDINPHTLRYLRQKLIRNQLSAQLFEADMAEFQLQHRFDAAFCTVDTFRHLLTEKKALSHLKCMANVLKHGAIYIIGMHLVTDTSPGVVTTRWSHSRGQLTVKTIMKAIKLDMKQRLETLEVILKPETKQKTLQSYQSIYQLRTYTLRQFKKLIKKSDKFEIVEAFDEYYNSQEPIILNNEIDYAVFILKRL
ncbi:MAG: class I SAM-dependent methyltransferase, partial [Pseudomonadota bacterium]